MTAKTQVEAIIQYMKGFGSITSYESVTELGIVDLRIRITDIRRSGVNIVSEWVEKRNRYGQKVRFKKYSIGGDSNS